VNNFKKLEILHLLFTGILAKKTNQKKNNGYILKNLKYSTSSSLAFWLKNKQKTMFIFLNLKFEILHLLLTGILAK
jgi:hypothetical protein